MKEKVKKLERKISGLVSIISSLEKRIEALEMKNRPMFDPYDRSIKRTTPLGLNFKKRFP